MVSTATRIPSLTKIRSSLLCHVPLLRVDGVDLHLPPTLKRGFDFLDQPPFLGIDKVLIQVTGSCNQEWLTTLGFGIELPPYQVPETIGPVRVSKESIQGDAGHRLSCLDAHGGPS